MTYSEREREFTFAKNKKLSCRKETVRLLRVQFLANVNLRSRSLYAIGRPSVCRLSSVPFVHSTQVIEIFGNVSTPCVTLAIRDL